MLHQQGDRDFYGHMNKKTRLIPMDRISDIPDPIVHHIMSLLTNLDVTKLSILSKRFLFLWGSFPIIEFDITNFSGSISGRYSISTVNRFLDHILNSLNLRRLSGTYILSEFKVNVNLNKIKTDDRFDEAISIVNRNGVKMIDLNLGSSEYKLPDTFSSKWCNVLRLQGFQLDVCKLIRTCPLLRTICLTDCIILKDMKVSSQTLDEVEISRCKVKCIKINAPNLQSFTFNWGYRTFNSEDSYFNLGYRNRSEACLIDVSKCQEITYLSIKNVVNGKKWIEEHVYNLRKLKTLIMNACRDVEEIRVSSEKLERVEIIDCPKLSSTTIKSKKLERLEICNCPRLSSTTIKAKSIEYFVFKGSISDAICIDKFVNTKYIKDMSLEGAFITDQWLESVIAILSCLERLRLHGCNRLNKIRVYHEKLKSFELTNCTGLKEADIDTPLMESFVYRGKIITFNKMVTRSNCIATLCLLMNNRFDETSVFGWRELLSFFGHCKALILNCYSDKEMIVPELLKDKLVSPLYDLEHLEIRITLPARIGEDLMDSLLWLTPLSKTIIISYANLKHQMEIKFVYADPVSEEDKDPFCCIFKPIKCWRHNLSHVEIRTNDVSPNNGSTELEKYFVRNVPGVGFTCVST